MSFVKYDHFFGYLMDQDTLSQVKILGNSALCDKLVKKQKQILLEVLAAVSDQLVWQLVESSCLLIRERGEDL